jgi:Domain of unknown function (DUF4157)
MRDWAASRDRAQGADESVETGGVDPRMRAAMHRRALQRKAKRDGAGGGGEQQQQQQQQQQHAGAGAADKAAQSGGGQPLPGALQQKFGQQLGTGLGDVRVHTGADSAAANEALGARAYTEGKDIHFGAGEYDPESQDGQELIAHEVVHTQQPETPEGAGAGAGPATKLEMSSPGDASEREADDASAALVDGAGPVAVRESRAGVARADKKHHKKKTEAPADDWEVESNPKQEKAESFEPIIGMLPDEQQATVPLGGKLKEEYYVSNASHAPKKGLKYEWEQQLTGRQTATPELSGVDGHKGTKATANFKARGIGDRQIATKLWTTNTSSYETKKAEAPALNVNVPIPAVENIELSSESKKWGKRPVLDEMLSGEDLIVTVKYKDLAVEKGEADLKLGDDESFTQKEPGTVVKPDTVRTVLTPKKTGNLAAKLTLQALESSGHAANFNVNVDTPNSEDDSGQQPAKSDDHSMTDNAVEQVVSAWDSIQTMRETALHDVLEASKKEDPPPSDPMWETILKTAAEIALEQFTGGLSKFFAKGVTKRFLEHAIENEKVTDVVQEFAGSFINKGMNAGIEKAKDVVSEAKNEKKGHGHGKGEGGEKKDESGIKRDLATEFYDMQSGSIAKSQRTMMDRTRNEVRHHVDDLEKKNPQSGVRYAMALSAEAREEADSGKVWEEQYKASFAEWCNLMARNQLGTNAKGNGKDDIKGSGTDLSEMVTTGADLLERHEQTNGDQYRAWGGDGPEKVSGVLRLELDADPRRPGHVHIKKATLPGAKSEDFASTISATPLGQLEMNVVAILRSGKEEGAVIGRNEKFEYYAAEHDSEILEDIAGTHNPNALGGDLYTKSDKSPQEIAKMILGEWLGEKPVKNVKLDR